VEAVSPVMLMEWLVTFDADVTVLPYEVVRPYEIESCETSFVVNVTIDEVADGFSFIDEMTGGVVSGVADVVKVRSLEVVVFVEGSADTTW